MKYLVSKQTKIVGTKNKNMHTFISNKFTKYCRGKKLLKVKLALYLTGKKVWCSLFTQNDQFI